MVIGANKGKAKITGGFYSLDENHWKKIWNCRAIQNHNPIFLWLV